MRPFEVTIPNTSVNLGPAGKTSVTFSVSNVSGRALRANYVLLPDDPSKSSWLTLNALPTYDFSADNALVQVGVSIAAPAGAAAGTSTFKLRALSAEKPDDDFTDSPTVAFTVGAKPPPPPFPWWAIVVAVVIVAIAIGAVGYVATRPQAMPTPVATSVPTTAQTVTVPAGLVGLSLAQTINALSGVGLHVANVCGTIDPVRATTPASGTQVAAGSGISIILGSTTFARCFVYIHPPLHFKVLESTKAGDLLRRTLDAGQIAPIAAPT